MDQPQGLSAAGVDWTSDKAGAQQTVHGGCALTRWGVFAGGLAGTPFLLQCALWPFPQAHSALGQVSQAA